METMITAILLSLVALFSNLDYFFGGSMLARPLVTGPIVGLVMGDLYAGITIGAMLELAFIGSFSIGAALPPDMVTGTILGIAFAISTGQGAEVAITLALPIATLVLVLKNLVHVFVYPRLVSAADRGAARGDAKCIARMQIGGGFIYCLLAQMLPVGLGNYFGADAVQGILNAIPAFVMDGLSIATGILPAYGLALLMKPLLNKQSVIFFLAGFAFVVYLNLSLTAVAFFGLFLALILTGFVYPKGMSPMPDAKGEKEGINYDTEEF